MSGRDGSRRRRAPSGAAEGPDPPLVRRARRHPERIALSDPDGRHRYRDVLDASARLAARLLQATGRSDLAGAPVAHLSPRGFPYVVHQWAVWRAGGMAVPLALSHPPRELAYALDDADPAAVVAHPTLAGRVAPLADERGVAVLRSGASDPPGAAGSGTPDLSDADRPDADVAGTGLPDVDLPGVEEARPALMLYTSGTTGRPKGVVHTHRSLRAQIETLVDAWAWKRDDRILLVLPLHHLHGILNVLACALWSGARCDVLRRFDAGAAWERFATGDLTLFMAVPTIYHRLISSWEEADDETRGRWSNGARGMRLMVSGSAALPVPVLERWREITGHTLLERYGMTEIGMGLSNPLRGERRPGHVGRPLPGVRIRLVDDDGRVVADHEGRVVAGDGRGATDDDGRVVTDTGGGSGGRGLEAPGAVGGGAEGEIQVRGPGLFREYWRRPDVTREAFTDDGWFRTGDLARIEDGHYRILGRRSVDIIKSGGYKISALEVEAVLRGHPSVEECAVVGVADAEWGERVAAALVAPDGREPPATDALRAWAKERLAPYKVPTVVKRVAVLPRNAMGKVTKPQVRELF